VKLAYEGASVQNVKITCC